MGRELLLIYVALDLAEPLIERVLVTGLLVSELALQLFGVFLDVVVVVAHGKGFNHIVPTG
jgi:hypothetical protein